MRPAVLCLVLALPFQACDLPTRLPLYDTYWDVVAVRDSISTDDLLPAAVRATSEGFTIDSWSVDGEVLLGDVCEVCTCFEGPVPSFEIAPHDWPVELPPGLIGATLERGSAHLVLHNHVGFDVLDDGDGGRGFLAVALTDVRDGKVMRQVAITEPFPPGDSLRLSFDMTGLALSQYLVARVHGFMPGSKCPVPLTPESGFRSTVELRDVLASSVEVWVTDQALRLPERSFDLPSFVAERLRPGDASLTLEVAVETSLPADLEIGLSAAGRLEDLFSERAALYTPLLIPAGSVGASREVSKTYVVQIGPLYRADRIHLDTRNRFVARGPMRLEGGESVSYRVRLRAEVPSR